MSFISDILSRLRPTAEIITANHRYFSALDRNRRLSEYTYVVYDTELTGLDRRKDEIISIGAVRISDMRIDLGETFHYYVRPQNLDHTKATLIHKITPEQLKAAPPLEEVLPLFLKFIETDLLVGHYVWIDTGFLNKVTRKLYNGVIANPNLDTMRMAQVYKKSSLYNYRGNYPVENRGYNLQKLSTELNLPFFEAHDAFEDALQTAYLFIYLVRKLELIGITTINELFKAGKQVDWTTMKVDGV